MKTFAVRLLSALCLASLATFGSPSLAASDSVEAASSEAEAVMVGQTVYKDEVVPYVKVALVNVESGEVVSETVSDGEGRFSLGAYEAGAYHVVAYTEGEGEGQLSGGAIIDAAAESTEVVISLVSQAELETLENMEHAVERGWSCSRIADVGGYSIWYCIDTCGLVPNHYWDI